MTAPAQATVRPAREADPGAIARVQIGSWQLAYRGQISDAYLDRMGAELERRTAYLRHMLSARAERVVVSEEGDRVGRAGPHLSRGSEDF